MSIYSLNGTELSAVYDVEGNSLDYAYDIEGNIIFSRHQGYYDEQIGYLKDWLVNLATYTANSKTYVRERYRMDNWSWSSGATAMAMAQTALTYLKLWEYTSNSEYLTTARALISSLESGRNQNGSFGMFIYNGTDTHVYTGGNSEVPIALLRCAEIDTDNASTYIAYALESTDFLLSIQNQNGSWRTVDNDTSQTALFTAQAVTALAMGYAHTSNQSGYRTAIENGIAFINTQLLPDGRIKTCREVKPTTEYWRPPTSDQSIVIRGIAAAEYYLPNNANVADWRSLRQTLLVYLNDCIGTEGAVRNGLETTSLPNDFYGLTDHVYTTSWAIEAYYLSSLVDESESELATSKGIVHFCSTNLYFNVGNVNTNGTIRGAYNIQDDNWDTSALTQDLGNEGGADMIYVGWVMSPICTWMINYSN